MICQCQFCNTLWSRKWRWTHTSPLDVYLSKKWFCHNLVLSQFSGSYLTLRKKGNWRSKERVWSWSKATSILQFRSFSPFFLREHPWHSVKARTLCPTTILLKEISSVRLSFTNQKQRLDSFHSASTYYNQSRTLTCKVPSFAARGTIEWKLHSSWKVGSFTVTSAAENMPSSK